VERGTIGKYETRAVLGRGAMGTVFDAWDPFIARRVAIKTIAIPDISTSEGQDILHRFRREAQAAGRLSHPNIVAVHDYGEVDGFAYIVMEFVEGTDIVTFLDTRKQHDTRVTEIVRLVQDLLSGLEYSHHHGVLHRDIKPANVLVTGAGRLKICDFGVARIESSDLTQSGTVIGTPAYMSPEQLIGRTADARSDLYSVGVLLYQLLTGEKPFEGSLTSIIHKALHTEPPRPSVLALDVPPALDLVVERAMARRPDDRFRTAVEFSEALTAAASGTAERESKASFSPPADATVVRTVTPPVPIVAAELQPDPEVVTPPMEVAQVRRRRVPVLITFAALVSTLAIIGAALLFQHGQDLIGRWLPTSTSGTELALKPPPTGTTLVDAIVALLPPETRTQVRWDVENYAKSNALHRSIAVTSKGFTFWRGQFGTRQESADVTLEACAVYSGQPCPTLAIDMEIVQNTPVVRAMPRVAYAGAFDPRQIPTLQSARRLERDIQEYPAVPGFKAIALHPLGRLFTTIASTSQQEADDSALRSCAEDPTRKGQAGPCYLYAEGNSVVLPHRVSGREMPFAIAKGPDELLVQLVDTFPQSYRSTIAPDVRAFLNGTLNRALAFNPQTGGTFRWSGRSVLAGLENGVLEACELYFRSPCRIVAFNNTIVPISNDTATGAARVSYAGPFDRMKIPGVELYVRDSAPVWEYASAAGAKAMAIHLTGYAYTAIGMASQAEADAAALDTCVRAHPTGEGSACYLYASADRVVLAEHRTKATR
jgi:hypothetical protein